MVWCFLCALVLLWCSLLSEERSLDHQGLEWGQSVFMGVWRPRVPLILVTWHSNQVSRALTVRNCGGGRISGFLRVSCVAAQSTLDQSGVGCGGISAGVAKDIRTGTLSEPVDSYGVSQPARKGVRELEAKAKSRTASLPILLRGNLVYIPGVFSREEPHWAAIEKNGSEARYSLRETSLLGSEE